VFRNAQDRYDFTDVQFADQAHGWITEASGTPGVIRTVDGGRTWTETANPTYGGTAIVFLDTMNGWTLGGIGVKVTHDGGVTWHGQPLPESPNTAQLKAISFSDPLHGYAVGTRSFRTDDGGATWIELALPKGGVTSVVAIGSRHVRVTAEGNIVLTSDDGGQTWVVRRVSATTDQALNAVDFVDEQHGWVVGDDGVIRRSDDGGATWADQVSGTTEDLRDVMFTDLLHGTAVGGTYEPPETHYGVILTTGDGGATWTARPAATPNPRLFRKVWFVDATHGWLAGDDGLQSTSDGGQTWTMLGRFEYVADVQFIDLQHGFVVMQRQVHATTDGGTTWIAHDPFATIRSFVDDPVTAVQFADPLHGLAAGGGSVGRTVDGGLTWTAQVLNIGGGRGDQRL
jgi:photosystem II stability/assembly factor-like uncharacterized protein